MRIIYAAVVATFLWGAASFVGGGTFGEAEVGLPPLPSDRRDIYEFYKLGFLPDGYPARRTDKGLVPHPIYGAYVIYDYLRLRAEKGEDLYLAAAEKVAQATLARMEKIPGHDALGFYYDPDSALSYYPTRFISGLTQARYLNPLYTLYKETGNDRYATAAKKILNSLYVPQTEGGVAIDTRYGPALEEYPHEIPTYVLNGWTSIVLELLNYAERAKDEAASELARRNIATMERLLPRYDMPSLITSRYQLTGFAYIKIVFDRPKTCKLDELKTSIDGVAHGLAPAGNRWRNHVLPKTLDADGFPSEGTIQVNAVFSQIEDSQRIDASFSCRAPATADVYVAGGDYNPLLSAMPTQRWILLGSWALKNGSNNVELTSPPSNFTMIGYPTNFAKKIAGKNYNVYHWLHITNMRRITQMVPSQVLDYYARKWSAYVADWDSLPNLVDRDLSFCQPVHGAC